MVRCTLCSEEMIVEGGDFSDHIDECPEGSIPKGLSIHDYDPVQEIKEHLNEKYQNITLSIPPQIHDRFIITDKYEILLGSGLQAYVDNTVIMGGINTTVLSVDDDK